MQEEYIKIEDLKDRTIYRVNARNSNIGIWSSKIQGFVMCRSKFGELYLFIEYHWDSDPHYGTVTPFQEIGILPENFILNCSYENQELLNYLINLKEQ